MMNGKVRAFNGDMGMAMSVFKDMVGKVRFVFADPPYKITQARYDKEGFDYKSMWEVIQKMLCPDGVVAVTCSLTAAVEIMRVAPAGWYRYDLVKILDTNIHESGRCGNGSGSRERNDRYSGLRGGKGLPAYGDRPSIL